MDMHGILVFSAVMVFLQTSQGEFLRTLSYLTNISLFLIVMVCMIALLLLRYSICLGGVQSYSCVRRCDV